VLVITLLAGAAAWDAPETDNSATAKLAIFVLVFMFISLYLVVGWLVLRPIQPSAIYYSIMTR
jgi:hypothetical protein